MEEIKQKISERLKDFLEKNFEMFRVFDVTVWNVDKEDIPNETKNDGGNIECIYETCKHLLDIYGFDIKAAKKECKRVKCVVIDKFMKLRENPTMMWCRFLTTYGHLYDNIAMILEIMIVLLTTYGHLYDNIAMILEIMQLSSGGTWVFNFAAKFNSYKVITR